MTITQRRSKSIVNNVGIYIQVPFCQTKCTYCNFHTGVFSKGLYSPYVNAVCKEIRESPSLRDAHADTIYIGGGTPSLLDPADLSRILSAIRQSYGEGWEEVTLEADPETITAEKARVWRAAGVNRVSMGVQSFCDAELRAAGRMHRRDDVYRANEILRQSQFTNISMDLIAGLAHQTRESWAASLRELSALRSEHVSVYLLEVDDGSRLGREILRGGQKYGAAAVPTDDDMADFYEFACAALRDAGYDHYEISNWALSDRASRHNLKYWRRQPYLGFGAGAHSFDGAKRWANLHDPAAYARAVEACRSAVESEEAVTPAQARDEEFFLGLRELAGVNLTHLGGKLDAATSSRIEKLSRDGLLEREGDFIRLNPAKLTISNEVFAELLG